MGKKRDRNLRRDLERLQEENEALKASIASIFHFVEAFEKKPPFHSSFAAINTKNAEVWELPEVSVTGFFNAIRAVMDTNQFAQVAAEMRLARDHAIAMTSRVRELEAQVKSLAPQNTEMNASSAEIAKAVLL